MQLKKNEQALSCPQDWRETYKKYMLKNNIKFREHIEDGDHYFVLPKNRRPHAWKLEKNE